MVSLQFLLIGRNDPIESEEMVTNISGRLYPIFGEIRQETVVKNWH